MTWFEKTNPVEFPKEPMVISEEKQNGKLLDAIIGKAQSKIDCVRSNFECSSELIF